MIFKHTVYLLSHYFIMDKKLPFKIYHESEYRILFIYFENDFNKPY